MMKRSSGVLMPMSALPSKYGIGSVGKCAYEFVDFLKAAGQKYLQLLPLGPTSYGDSPYSSFSSFAGNPYFIDLELLIKEGLLSPSQLKGIDWGAEPDRIDYGLIYESRYKVLRLAYEKGREPYSEKLSEFKEQNMGWLNNYALFMAVKKNFNMKSWTQWPEEDSRFHKSEAVQRYSKLLKDEIDFQVFIQYLFFRQWTALREYAHEKGVQFIGDVPIYVALDSADVWSEPGFFQLDGDNIPLEVAGVPPDEFTAEGQLWGNPLYDWDEMKKDGYGWWIRRIDGARKLYDIIRIDHFRGFESYWAVPNSEKTAINGHWKPGPGMELVGVLTSWFSDLGFIAEDLGYTTPQVQSMLKASGLPGMKLLQFAFDSGSESDYLPHRYLPNSVCYIGTHDNDTVKGWLSGMSREDKAFAKRYMHISDDEDWCWGLIRSGMASPSELFVVQMQDLLELGGDCRVNTPGTNPGQLAMAHAPRCHR